MCFYLWLHLDGIMNRKNRASSASCTVPVVSLFMHKRSSINERWLTLTHALGLAKQDLHWE